MIINVGPIDGDAYGLSFRLALPPSWRFNDLGPRRAAGGGTASN